jgi:hypothetical protein
VKHRDLLAAVADLEPVRLEGVYERQTALRWNDDLSGSAAGGRWGAPRAFEVLYLGRPTESVIVEAYRHLVEDELDDPKALASQVLQRQLLRCRVDVDNILDLRPSTARIRIGLDDGALHSDVGDYGVCQQVGAAAHQLQLAGLIAPAATGLGETLALFPTNLAVERWPEIIERQVWDGLPADPRRLRLVDEAT